MDAVTKALRLSAPKLLELPNVVGVGRGHKHVGGRCIGKPVVTVLVTKKLPKHQLEPYALVPESIERAETDVIEVGEVVALASRTDRQRPARPGVSIGHFKVTAGTFGAVVYDVKTGEPLILSNNHVLANTSNGRDKKARVGDPILQPGRYDGGTEKDIIARLYKFVPINLETSQPTCAVANAFEKTLNRVIRKFKRDYYVKVYTTGHGNNFVDAAVAKPLSNDLINPDIIDIGIPKGMADVEVGEKVVKSGRTSGTNWGTVKVVDATIKISMGDSGDAVFTDQVVTTHMAKPGDSGSLVLNERHQAVGLLSAGSDSVSIFSRIKNVCDALGVRI